MRKVIERRRREQQDLIAEARTYIAGVAAESKIRKAFVVGSVARGDFNVWSDTDVVAVCDSLPPGLDRFSVFSDAPGGIEVIPFTTAEFEREAERKRNPMIVEAMEIGILLLEQGS
jgi:uncharacterized protein